MRKIKKNSKKNLIKLLIFFIFFINPSISTASNFQYTHKSNDKIKISEKIFNKLIEYKTGNFYSKIYKQKFTETKGMYFALAKNGNSASFSFCEDGMIGCMTNLLKYQTLKKCERIANDKCYIIAIGNSLVINKKKISLKEANEMQKIFIIEKNKTNQENIYEIRAITLREFENSDPYE